MKKNLHLITGASRGLGLGMARHFAAGGDHVVSLSRTATAGDLVKTIRVDLARTESFASLMDEIFADHGPEDFAMISLINNAGMVEPVAPVVRLAADDVRTNIALNLTAPIALIAAFLRKTAGYGGERVIMNVSSGVARHPKETWAAYSAAKAGLEAFSVALNEEIGDARNRVVIFNPGIMDTAMQARIRSSRPEDFPDLQRFIEFKEKGSLVDPDRVGRLAARVVLGELAKDRFDVSVSELLPFDP